MKAILIIAHHCILPGAYKGFEEILDKLHHDLPGTRVASTSLLDLENDLRTLLREDVESVTLLPFLLLNGQHAKNDVPRVVARLQAEFPQIPITLLPCLGDWKEFGEDLSRCRIEKFDVTKYQDEYINAPKNQKDDTFLGKFIKGAMSQKGMVTAEIFKSGNILAGISKAIPNKNIREFITEG